MRIVGFPRSFLCIARHPPAEPSPKAQERLRLIRAWKAMQLLGLSRAEAAGIVGVSRA
jgi:hypothetical protein